MKIILTIIDHGREHIREGEINDEILNARLDWDRLVVAEMRVQTDVIIRMVKNGRKDVQG